MMLCLLVNNISAPCTVYQGERVWWTRHDHEQTMPFILKEVIHI